MAGPHTQGLAEKIREEADTFLRTELKVQLNLETTQIAFESTHPTTQRVGRANYLGFEIARRGPKLGSIQTSGRTRRATKTRVQMCVYAPISKLVDNLVEQGFARSKDKPKAVTK